MRRAAAAPPGRPAQALLQQLRPSQRRREPTQVGVVKHEELLKLRELDNNLEGHPTPRLEFVDVATGSLGQGLPAGIGSALNARRIKSDYRTYVLMGDGETAEGSVWEAAEAANHFQLDNLVGITDVNRLGQSRPTMWQHDMEALARRWRALRRLVPAGQGRLARQGAEARGSRSRREGAGGHAEAGRV